MTDKGKEKHSDPAWDHCTKVVDGKNKRLQLKCNYCGKVYWGGVSRIKHHLARTSKDVAPCTKSSDEVRDIFLNILDLKKEKKGDDLYFGEDDVMEVSGPRDQGGPMDRFIKKKVKQSGTTLNTLWKKGNRDTVCLDIARFLYANALPFNLVKSPFFKRMMESVASFGPGLKLPSYHEVRVPFLKKEVQNISNGMEKYKIEWKNTGCTLMSDGWTDGKSRSITNFLVNSPSGTVFLKSIDTSDIIKNADNLFDLLDSLVEEIGEDNVVQVVTDSAAAYVKAGELLMEKRKHIFWSPCTAHILDLILSDIGDIPVHKDTVEKARKLTVYIYRHAWVLNLMRKHTKGRDLTRPAVTRFATAYLTLKSVHEQKVGLRAMFACEEWARSSYSKKTDGCIVQEIVLSDPTFWKGIQYCLKCVLPLVKVLRLVDGDARPPMGYIYEAMDRAKEQIEKNFSFVKNRYQAIWEIIDKRWDLQLHRPLHAAAYYLNPKFQYDPDFNPDYEIKSGLYQTIERMCPDITLRIKIDEQLEHFRRAEKLFGIDMAKITRDKKQPALWWESYGGSCKELQKLAIRILSLTCSATGCERNWSTFDQIHSKRRNRLEQQRLNALVYVKYNLQLEARHKQREEANETYDPICLSDMESDDEWITEREDPCLQEEEISSWMDIHECFEIKEGEAEGSKKRKRGPRNLNPIGKGKKKVVEFEEEDEFESEGTEEEEIEGAAIEVDDISDNDDDGWLHE